MRGTYTSDETTLSFVETGEGLPVVFLHPTPLNGEYWRLLIGHLPAIRAIIPDLRGHGASELGTRLPAGAFDLVPDAPVLSIGQLASDILALLDHLQVKDAVFAGCSIGGYVLLELWRRAPERMRGLGFICSKPQLDAETNRAKRAAMIAQARAGMLDALFDGFADSQLSAATHARNPQLVREIRAQMTLTEEAEIAVQAGLVTRPDSVPTIASVTVPVLAVAGAEDKSVSPEEMEAFCAAPGGCTYEVFSDAGHYAACEQPEKIAALMRSWLPRE